MPKSEPFFGPLDMRPHIGPPIAWSPPLFRSRRVCLSLVDWKAFGDALARIYPEERYLRTMTVEEKKSPEKPSANLIASHLCAFNDRPEGPPWEIDFTLGPKWQLKLEPFEQGWSRWKRDPLDYPFLVFRPEWQWLVPPKHEMPEHLREGSIEVQCSRVHKPHLAFARRFYKLFSQFATNKNQHGMRYPSYEILWTLEKGSDLWLGHDAIRWAREDQRRLLGYDRHNFGYRPA